MIHMVSSWNFQRLPKENFWFEIEDYLYFQENPFCSKIPLDGQTQIFARIKAVGDQFYRLKCHTKGFKFSTNVKAVWDHQKLLQHPRSVNRYNQNQTLYQCAYVSMFILLDQTITAAKLNGTSWKVGRLGPILLIRLKSANRWDVVSFKLKNMNHSNV